MTRIEAERVALKATLLAVLVLLYDQISYRMHVWPW
jgi:hypothetical protein